MKKLIFTLIAAFVASGAIAQFVRLEVEEIDNQGKVDGKTYRIYAVVEDPKDHVHAVFGQDGHELRVESTKPFFQSKYGGGMSKEVNRSTVLENEELKYDSWVTIGFEDNYSNGLNVFIMTLDEFEKGNALVTSDGAWFVTPDHEQAFAGDDKRILLLQLTSAGTITGVINVQGRTKDGEVFKEFDLDFTCK